MEKPTTKEKFKEIYVLKDENVRFFISRCCFSIGNLVQFNNALKIKQDVAYLLSSWGAPLPQQSTEDNRNGKAEAEEESDFDQPLQQQQHDKQEDRFTLDDVRQRSMLATASSPLISKGKGYTAQNIASRFKIELCDVVKVSEIGSGKNKMPQQLITRCNVIIEENSHKEHLCIVLQIVNASKQLYLVGSRLWGAAGVESDWDVVIVKKRSSTDDGEMKKQVGVSTIDALIYSEEQVRMCPT